MRLVPLGDRVLIKPSTAPAMTESGLHLVEHWKPEQTGTVVAVGHAKHPRKDEALEVADWLLCNEVTNPQGSTLIASDLIRELVHREPLVKVGDDVIFSWSAGQEIWVEDGAERYLLMYESDILAIVETEVPA